MFLTLILIFAAAVGSGAPLMADVLLIEEVRQSDRMDLPLNGHTMDEVESRFGSPVNKHAAVGDPPIARWEYDRWSVYFEFGRVLFTVLHKGEVINKD